MKKFVFIILALTLIVYAPQVSAETPQKGGNLVVCQPAEPPSGLDPTAGTSAAIDRIVYANIYEGLVKTNSKGEFVPGLATKWDISSDGKLYTFYLRKEVKFHNGEPFNAQVAKWNLDRAMAEDTKNVHPEYFRVIDKIETPDDFTLIVHLKDVDALFIAHMAEGDAVMLPMKGYENANTNPIGTGPFMFVKWVRGDRVEMVRFEGYWNPALPYLNNVTFKFIGDASAQIAALKAGDIDVLGWISAPESAAELSKDQRFKYMPVQPPARLSCRPTIKPNPLITKWSARPWPMPSIVRPLSTLLCSDTEPPSVPTGHRQHPIMSI